VESEKIRFAVTGLGIVSPLGTGIEKNWQRLIDSESAVRYEIKNEAFIARAEGFDMPENLRQLAIGFFAAQEAVKDAGLITSGYEKDRIGLSCGESKPNLFHESFVFDSGFPEQIKNILKIEGQMSCVSAACATGTLTVIKGCDFIENDICDAVICGTSETSIHPLYTAGFKNMGALSKRGHRPFGKERDGFSIGEGAGFIVIEDLKKAALRGAKIYCELGGFASGIYTNNTINIDSSNGMERIIKNTVNNEIPDFIHAHGTGTKLNDYYESEAIKRQLGVRNEELGIKDKENAGKAVHSSLLTPNSSFPLVSSTKAATGHMLGVSGIAGAIFSILAMRDSIVPPTLNFTESDIPFNLNYVKNIALAQPVNSALSLSFGFGGQGAALYFKKSNLC